MVPSLANDRIECVVAAEASGNHEGKIHMVSAPPHGEHIYIYVYVYMYTEEVRACNQWP